MDRAKHKNNSGVGSIRHSNAELIQHYKSVRIVTQILGLDATYSKNPSYCTTVDVDVDVIMVTLPRLPVSNLDSRVVR